MGPAARPGPCPWFCSDARVGRFRPSRPRPGKARSRSARGACRSPCRVAARDPLDRHGDRQALRYPRVLAGEHQHRGTKGRFFLPIDPPSSAGPASSQPSGYRAATCGDTGPAPHGGFTDVPAFPRVCATASRGHVDGPTVRITWGPPESALLKLNREAIEQSVSRFRSHPRNPCGLRRRAIGRRRQVSEGTGRMTCSTERIHRRQRGIHRHPANRSGRAARGPSA